MSSAPTALLPTHSFPGERARGERLAAQPFHPLLYGTERAGTLYPPGSEAPRRHPLKHLDSLPHPYGLAQPEEG